MTSTNGKGTVTQVVEQAKDLKLEVTPTEKPQPKKRTKREPKNKKIEVSMTLDAGSKRIKLLLDGFETVVESIYKEVKGDLPSGSAGCFGYKNKNYYVGRGCHGVLGELIESHKDNKIKKLDIWLIGALTSDTDFLDELIDCPKANKYKNKPILLNISLKLLSLSSNKRGDIKKILGNIGSFNYRGREFSVTFTNLEDEFIYSEGFGAALTAKNLMPDGTRELSILDLGAGTLTLTTYKIGRKLPKRDERTVASGGGMQNLASKIFISLNKTDKGGETKSLESIFQALKACSSKNNDYFIPYRFGAETTNIYEEVVDGLSHWVADNPSIANILTKASQVLLSGGYVFATGGGFASGVIADWIKSKIISNIETANYLLLENPGIINVSGMKLLER